MKRRSPRRRTDPASENGCRALVPADGPGLRRRLKRDYDRAGRDVEKARAEMERFQRDDAPQFQRWLHRTFGRQLTELRELAAKVAQAAATVMEVESESLFSGTSYSQSYARVRRRHEGGEPPPPPEEIEEEEAAFVEIEAEFERLFDEAARPRSRSRKAAPKESPATARPENRLKDLYRALVRLLHPDKLAELTPQKRECWHQVQAAYAKGDADQLEVILTLCELEAHGPARHTTAWAWQQLTRQLRETLRHLRRELREARTHPAWEFSQRENHYPLELKVGRELEMELAQGRAHLAALEATLADWQRPRRRERKSRNEWGR